MNEAEELAPHWLMYKMEYAAFPTTTHFVERSVKVYNFCSNKSRTEERVSQLAICYNIVHDVNDLTKELMIKEKEKKGQSYKDADNIKAVGKLKYKTVLQNVVSRHNKIEMALASFPRLKDVYNDIKTGIAFNEVPSFKDERQNDYFNRISNAMEKPRKPNRMENQKGVFYTPAVRNQVRFHDTKAGIHNDGLEAELEVRGFTDFASLTTFTQLRNKLKTIMIEKGETETKNEKEVKFFSIQSKYDWTKMLQKKN